MPQGTFVSRAVAALDAGRPVAEVIDAMGSTQRVFARRFLDEFRAFAGISPSRYAPRAPSDLRHVPIIE